MKPSTLPRARTLGIDGEKLRQYLSHVIDQVQRDATIRGGTSPKATQLTALMTAVNTAITSLRDVTAPTVVSRTQPVGVNTITVLYNEDLDPEFVSPLTQFVIAPARTVVGVRIEGRRLFVDYSGVALTSGNSPTLAYTQVASGHRDAAGNLAATFAALAVTVA